MADTAKEIVERLRARSNLHRDWDKWELGDKPVPEATNFAETADELAEAATLIEQLVAERDAAVLAEREACAAMLEYIIAGWYGKPPIPSMSGEWPKELVRAIRARSTHA